MRRSAIALAATAITLALAPTASAQYPPDRPICVVERSRVAPGEELTITGDRWRPSSAVDIDFDQDDPAFARDLGGATANVSGTFVETVTIPPGAHPGAARLSLSGQNQAGEPATCTADLTITGDVDEAACAQISDDEVFRQQEIQVFSQDGCWEANSTVTLTFFSTPVALGTAPVRSDGSFTKTIRIPAGATIGPHEIRVAGTGPSGAAAVRHIPLEVVAGRAGGGLSGTGLGVAGLLALAVGLLASGGSLVAASRRVPISDDLHPAYVREHERRLDRARWTIAGGIAALGAWLVSAALVPGDPAGLSWRHPVSAGTVVLTVAGAVVLWLAANGRPRR